MRLDIYRRAERGGLFSYLAVPEGKLIPEEATNTDWETEARGMDFDDGANELPRFSIEQPLQQINAKGYAITSSKISIDAYCSPAPAGEAASNQNARAHLSGH